MSESPEDPAEDIETAWVADHADQDHGVLHSEADDQGNVDWDTATTQTAIDGEESSRSIFDFPSDD
jgi:hypothetical protein